MGDRAVIYVKDSSAGVYLHWSGNGALEILKAAIPEMRKEDPDYSAARLCGFCCRTISGNTGVGLVPAPESLELAVLKEYSHGDAGVIVYDCETGETTLCCGYLAQRVAPYTEDGGAAKLILEIPPR